MIGSGGLRVAGRLERQAVAASPAQPNPSRAEPIMGDDSKPSRPENRATAFGSPLGEIARALGVPVSSFLASGTGAAGPMAGTDPDATVLLDLVRSYLLRVSPETRRRFVAHVQALAETPPR